MALLINIEQNFKQGKSISNSSFFPKTSPCTAVSFMFSIITLSSQRKREHKFMEAIFLCPKQNNM